MKYKKLNKNAKYTLGIEVEKEDRTLKYDSLYKEFLLENGWEWMSDGSLNSDGFEVCSPILDAQNLKKTFTFLQKAKKLLDANWTSNCGGHIHVASSFMSYKELTKEIIKTSPLLGALYPGRVENRWSYLEPMRESTDGQTIIAGKAIRSSAKYGTCEIRIFPAFDGLIDTR
jgi:hypothetical protein